MALHPARQQHSAIGSERSRNPAGLLRWVPHAQHCHAFTLDFVEDEKAGAPENEAPRFVPRRTTFDALTDPRSRDQEHHRCADLITEEIPRVAICPPPDVRRDDVLERLRREADVHSTSAGERRENGLRIDRPSLPNALRRLHQRRPLRVRHIDALAILITQAHVHLRAIRKFLFQDDHPT